MEYVYAVVKYVDVLEKETCVIYIAPKEYWEKAEDLAEYREVNVGSLESFIVNRLGPRYQSYDAVHWVEISGKSLSEIEDELEGIGMEYSETLADYASKEVDRFGDINIANLYEEEEV